jgi:hypothetical protein
MPQALEQEEVEAEEDMEFVEDDDEEEAEEVMP